MESRSRKSFHLIEFLVVVILIGVVVSFAIPVFVNYTRKVRDKQAHSDLALIQAAEKNYRIEMNSFITLERR